MHPLIGLGRATPLFLAASALACFALVPKAQAVVPPPAGGYPGLNTALGQNALFSLTSGVWNTALGSYTLYSDTTASGNTGVGLFALSHNVTGIFNTALGLGALSSNNGNPAALEGSYNCALGAYALFANTTGYRNSALGRNALGSNTTGYGNNALGRPALGSNLTGYLNNALGTGALSANRGGYSNLAFGTNALQTNVSGSRNTAVGDQALALSTSDINTAIGFGAGFLLTTGTFNVYIGSDMTGTAVESQHTYIRNINTTPVSGGGTDNVSVNLDTGLLGHFSSSRRYKEDINPLDNSSQALYRIRPVTFHYKKEVDPDQKLQFGLIAEDVAEVDPNLAIRGRNGQIESVRYTAINVMLLDQFLKEHKTVQEQGREIQERENTISQLEDAVAQHEVTIAQQRDHFRSRLAEQEKRLQALAAALQKVRADAALRRAAPQVADNP